MNNILKKLHDKIKSTDGTSIGEMLAAVMILLFATSVLVVTVSLGANHYISSLAGSEANVLSSTLQSIMTNELAYTSEIHTDSSGNVTSFQSQNYAVDENLSNFFVSGEGYGKVMIGTESSSLKLLGNGAYPNGLGVQIKQFTYNAATHTFTIELSIGRKNVEYLDQTFTVINVNKTVPQSA